ncbi:hypothetical protein QX233_01165 [Chryseobacterium gambrini]|uniref:Uncharacterized protein n=1 Tax=Chryseobacterium gambrini TaxID=373672 RepID=A0AAJ1VIX6_9FLAO|nr:MULTISPECIES: hypothetical protein [Chryseobacterium]MDN4011061.1 hypothetical protein [Chryseobacterium gambrini]QWA38767.1 hypothetical protein KKI44_00690 [Chryseobacterium sp. ZHDP1]
MYYSNILPIKFSRLNCSNIFSSNGLDFKNLKKFLEKDFQNEMVSFINQYYSSSDRGTVNYVNVSEDYVLIADNQLEIEVKCDLIYDVQYYNGCKDLDTTDEDQSMTVTIKIKKENCSADIIGDKIYERDSDEI